MVELVDTLDLESSPYCRGESSSLSVGILLIIFVKKYLFLLSGQLQILLEYRWEFLIYPIYRFIQMFIYFTLWKLTTSGDIEQERRLFLYYFLIFMIFHSIHSGKSAKLMSDAISKGELNQFLTKPINFIFVKTIESFAYIVSRVVFVFVILIVGIIIIPSVFAPYSFSSFVFFIIFAFVAILLWNLLNILIGLLSFWVLEIDAFSTVLDLVLNLFKGAWIPFYLFPDFLREILKFTPIPYIAAWPIEIYQNGIDVDQALLAIGVCMFWMTLGGLIANILYRRGLIHYEGYGG